ncbi:MAG: hypothetical protein AAF959_23315 [Cyanobacteria bacterium P01_D01_bin.56]
MSGDHTHDAGSTPILNDGLAESACVGAAYPLDLGNEACSSANVTACNDAGYKNPTKRGLSQGRELRDPGNARHDSLFLYSLNRKKTVVDEGYARQPGCLP